MSVHPPTHSQILAALMVWMQDRGPVTTGTYNQEDYNRMEEAMMVAQGIDRGLYNDMFAGISIDSMHFQSHDREAIKKLQRWHDDSNRLISLRDRMQDMQEEIKKLSSALETAQQEASGWRTRSQSAEQKISNLDALAQRGGKYYSDREGTYYSDYDDMRRKLKEKAAKW